MVKYYFYGGPADGGEVPYFMNKQDFILLNKEMDNIDVTYYYVRSDDNHWFEYAGEEELKEGDDSE